MSIGPHSVYAGKLALLGAFKSKGIDTSHLSDRFRTHVEETADVASLEATEIHEAALVAFEAAIESKVTIEQYQRSIKPKETSSVAHPASKRRCITSVNQAPS